LCRRDSGVGLIGSWELDLDRDAMPRGPHAPQIATLAKIPTLVMFGDHLGDVQGGPANWAASLESCEKYVQRVKDEGGDAEMMHLPKLGIKGNSHMLMQDRNSLQLADLILTWIDKHVEATKGVRR